MNALELAAALVHQFEGCRLYPYRDAAGYWTIGWGHLITPDRNAPRPSISWSQDEANAVLASDLAKALKNARSVMQIKPTAGEWAALGDFAFNLGLGSLRASTLLRRFNAGDIEGAAEEFPRWVHAGGMVLPGLIKRREAERQLFLGGMNIR